MNFYSKRIALSTLERDVDACCVLDILFRFVYCNPAWDSFARANGGNATVLGPALEGRSLLDFLPAALSDYYRRNLRRAFHGAEVWEHEYEASSPDEFRIFRLQTCALLDANELLIVHSLRLVRPHDRVAVSPEPHCHFTDGTATVCSHCRRTRGVHGHETWDWIPGFLAVPPVPRVDGLCPSCAAYYSGVSTTW